MFLEINSVTILHNSFCTQILFESSGGWTT